MANLCLLESNAFIHCLITTQQKQWNPLNFLALKFSYKFDEKLFLKFKMLEHSDLESYKGYARAATLSTQNA
jgi:hypothetical protein